MLFHEKNISCTYPENAYLDMYRVNFAYDVQINE